MTEEVSPEARSLTSELNSGSEDLLGNSNLEESDREIIFPPRKQVSLKGKMSGARGVKGSNMLGRSSMKPRDSMLVAIGGTLNMSMGRQQHKTYEARKDLQDLRSREIVSPKIGRERISLAENIVESKLLDRKRESQMEFERRPDSLINLTPAIGPTPRQTVESSQNQTLGNQGLLDHSKRDDIKFSSQKKSPASLQKASLGVKILTQEELPLSMKEKQTPEMLETQNPSKTDLAVNLTTVEKKITASSTQPNQRFQGGSIQNPRLNEISKIANLNVKVQNMAIERPKTLNQPAPESQKVKDEIEMDFLCDPDSEDGLDLDSQDDSIDKGSKEALKFGDKK